MLLFDSVKTLDQFHPKTSWSFTHLEKNIYQPKSLKTIRNPTFIFRYIYRLFQQWSNDQNQWTYTKRSMPNLLLFNDGEIWRIINTNTITSKTLISFSNGDRLSPLITNSISCQVFIIFIFIESLIVIVKFF